MAKKPSLPPLPPTRSLKATEKLAESCQRCPLYKRATQTVFGAGPAKARLMIVGEQPGHHEDLQGLPFVGPAGELLRHCLEQSGLSLEDIYLTNAVKHFKWSPAPSGKRRLHEKPHRAEIRACRPWLERQIALIKPRVVLALGLTAAESVLERSVRLTSERGKKIQDSPVAEYVLISWHPSAILRSPDREAADQKRQEPIKDLKLAATILKGRS